MGGRRAIRRLRDAPPQTAGVSAATTDGQGIVNTDGKRVFVAGALPGETVQFRRLRSRSNYDEAELTGVIEASPDRVDPPCRVFGRCGGCSLQHMATSARHALQERALLDALARIGSVTPQRVLPATSGEGLGYRRRARLAVRFVPGKERVLVGFSERDSSRITDMDRCEILHPRLGELPSLLSALIGSMSLARRIPQVEVAVADNASVLVFRVLDAPTATDIALLRTFRDGHGFRILLQGNAATELAPLDAGYDDGELWYTLPDPGICLTFGPTDFIQVNADVNRRLVALALDLLDPAPDARVLDLYCGIGNFTLPLARRAGHVLGIEGSAAMVERALRNACLNDIGNVAFRAGDLAGPAATGEFATGRFDTVLLDPPRAGAAAVLAALPAAGAQRILYVSCHPGTLARDAGVLVHELGYELAAAGILDMFPQTSHIESVALFERR